MAVLLDYTYKREHSPVPLLPPPPFTTAALQVTALCDTVTGRMFCPTLWQAESIMMVQVDLVTPLAEYGIRPDAPCTEGSICSCILVGPERRTWWPPGWFCCCWLLHSIHLPLKKVWETLIYTTEIWTETEHHTKGAIPRPIVLGACYSLDFCTKWEKLLFQNYTTLIRDPLPFLFPNSFVSAIATIKIKNLIFRQIR